MSSPRPSLEHLQQRAGKLIKSGIATNTQLAYSSGIRVFERFRSDYSLEALWPTTDQQIVLFIAYCFEIGRAPSTITTYLAGINFYHKINNWKDFQDSFVIQKILEGCRRSRPLCDLRAPITRKILVAICTVLPNTCYNQYESALFRALFALSYFGLFRVSEVVACAGTATLLVSDTTLEQNSITIRLQSYKTKQKGHPVKLKIPADSDIRICPVAAVRDYMAGRASLPGPLFCHANNAPVTRQQFSSVLSKCLKKTIYMSGHYRSHSFRIGRATDLASRGMQADTIMLLGRWRSDCYKHYIR